MITDGVPLIGGACTVLTGVCVAVIRCVCETAPILTVPIGNVTVCKKCSAKFAIVRVQFDMATGPGIRFVVDRVVLPVSEVT